MVVELMIFGSKEEEKVVRELQEIVARRPKGLSAASKKKASKRPTGSAR
jgi:hypothetical protein